MKDTIREFSFQMDLSTESDDNAMTNDNEVTFYIDGGEADFEIKIAILETGI